MQPTFAQCSKLNDDCSIASQHSQAAILPILLSVRNHDYEIAKLHKTAMAALEANIFANIYAQTPEFFENAIVDLLHAIGYGTGATYPAELAKAMTEALTV